MSDYVVVTSTSNTVTVVNQPSTLIIADSAMRGPTGPAGEIGPTGPAGPAGASGDRYRTNSNSTIQLSYGYKTLQVEPNLAYTVGQHVTASNSESHYFHGPVSQYYPSNGTLIVFASEWNFPAPDPDTYSKWDINLAGIPGPDGANGASANIQVGNVVTGAEGSNVTIVNVGNSTNVILDFSIPRGNTGNAGGGGGANTGNVTFQNNIVIGTGDEFGSDGLYFSAGPTQIANLQYVRLRGGEDPTHIHFDTANSAEYDFFFGDDNKFIKLEHGFSGNVVISPWNLNNKFWVFDTNGGITFPDNTYQTTAYTGGGGGGNTGNVTFQDNIVIGTGVGQTDGLYLASGSGQVANLQYLRLRGGDDDAHIHFDTANTEAYDFYIGDDSKYVKLARGSSGNIVVGTYGGDGYKTWHFASNGNLTLPGEIHGSITYGGGGVPNGRAVDIVPADDASDKKFKFRIDQYGETFTRAFFEMPEAQNNKQVAIAFPHANSNVGYIFTQGADTYDDGLNNAFNIFYNAGNIKVTAMTPGTGAFNTWKFGSSGILELPTTASGWGRIAGNNLVITGEKDDMFSAQVYLPNNADSANDPAGIYNAGNAGVEIGTGGIHNWKFNANGTLTFPDNTVQNTAYTGGGAGLPLANGTSNVNIALANGYVTVTANTYTWTFNETNGLLELAGNLANFSACSAINFVANSSGDGAGYSTIELRPDSNASLDQYLIIDPTQPNHIHIRAGGQQDNSNAEIYLGGENSYFKVNDGLDPSTSIASNGYVWTFNTDGTITFPDSTTQNTAYTGSGGGVGNVLVTANTGSQVNSGNINFINTSTVTVSVVSGDNGNANVSFTSIGGGGTIAAPNTAILVANVDGAANGTNNFVFNVATNRLGVGTNTPNSNIAVVGNVWVTTGINAATINITTANVTNVNGSSSLAIGTGIGSNGNVIIHANGVEILRATNARRIGINTTTPNSNVSIVGNVWVTTGVNAATINVTTANVTNVVTTNAIIGVANISGNLNVTGTISVTGATYGDLTGGNNITSNTFTANANIQQVQYTLSTVPGNIAITQGSTVNINNFSGMIIINNWTSGGIQMWLLGGGAVGNVGNTLDLTISNTGSITHSSPNYVWTAANTATYSFATVKTRDAG